MKKTPLDMLNHVIAINNEVKPGNGEDAYAYEFDDTRIMMAVFDGCGGLGSRRYEAFSGKTGAYIASRVLAAETLAWFEEDCSTSLQYRFEAALSELACANRASTAISGSMIKRFPSTASIILADFKNDTHIDVIYQWAGDSRGFLLIPSGLKQCTKDDLSQNIDPFDNLYEDASLANVVSAEGKYMLNRREVRVPYPAILITVSDGVFSYLPSPMHFEMMLVNTLITSSGFEMWEDMLNKRITEVASDDSTLVMAVLGWNSFDDMRRDFIPRYEALKTLKCDMDATNESRDGLREIWKEYSKSYCLSEVDDGCDA